MTTAMSQKGEPEMKRLVPLSTNSSPARTARVCTAPASEPASGSVMAKQMAFSARATGRMKRPIWSAVACFASAPTRGGPESSPSTCARQGRAGGVDGFLDEAVVEHAEAGAAQGLGQSHAVEAVVARAAPDLFEQRAGAPDS